MSVGGPSNLGTLLIRRLDTALSVAASQQSQIVNAGRSDAISQLADASRVNPLHNEGGRPLAETIDKALSQTEHQGRRAVDDARLHTRPAAPRTERPSTETSSTPSAPTTLGHAAKAILALLSRFPEQAPPVNGRAPLAQPGMADAAASAPPTAQAAPPRPRPSMQAAPPVGSAAPTGPAHAAGSSASGDVQAALIARALALAVRQSGLFYESHLRDLAFGVRTAAQLKLEPQGQLGGPAASANASAGSASHAAGMPGGGQPAVPQSAAQAGAQASEGTVETRGASATAGQPGPGHASSLAGLHPDTHLVVRQQLEVLAGQTFGWRGEAWPGAPLDWEISRRDEQGAPDEAGTHWATRLRLVLPALGEVEARLSLHDKQVVMRLVAPQSAQTLKRHDQALRADFQEAGLMLSQLSIKTEEET